MFTTKTLDLLLSRLPTVEREAHQAPNLTNNLLSVFVLCNTRCKIIFYFSGCEVLVNGETIIRGQRNMQTNMWRISLLNNGSNNIIPDDNQNITDKVKIQIVFANSVFKCKKTQTNSYNSTMQPWTSQSFQPGTKPLTPATSKGGQVSHKNASAVSSELSTKQRRGTWTNNELAFAPLRPRLINQIQRNRYCKDLYTTIATMSTYPFQILTAKYSAIRPDVFQSLQTEKNCYVVIFYTADGNYIKSSFCPGCQLWRS